MKRRRDVFSFHYDALKKMLICIDPIEYFKEDLNTSLNAVHCLTLVRWMADAKETLKSGK